MKRILAMDTSGPSLSVALLDADTVVYESIKQNGRTHSESLMVQVDAALKAGGIAPADVDCFAAIHGPGSFTGVRIGVATAKALSHATGKPCVGINALEALAHGVGLYDGVVCAMQDARAGQVYAAAFRGGVRVLEDCAVPLVDLLHTIAPMGPCCFVGDGAVRHADAIVELFGEGAQIAPLNLMAARASHVALLARIHAEERTDWKSLLPYYLRAPQAERERMAREEQNA